MYQPKLEKDIRCPLEYGLRVFGGKWKSRVLCVLSDVPSMRYSQLKEEMCNFTDSVLASALKELQQDGMIQRRQYDEIPPRVEYALTPKGSSVMPILRKICLWSGIYHKNIHTDAPSRCQKCDYRPPET